MINQNSEIYRLINNAWQQMPGTASTIDVFSPTRIVITDFDQNCYIWTGSDWKQLMGQNITQATINDTSVFGVSQNGSIWTLDT